MRRKGILLTLLGSAKKIRTRIEYSLLYSPRRSAVCSGWRKRAQLGKWRAGHLNPSTPQPCYFSGCLRQNEFSNARVQLYVFIYFPRQKAVTAKHCKSTEHTAPQTPRTPGTRSRQSSLLLTNDNYIHIGGCPEITLYIHTMSNDPMVKCG